MDPRDLDLNLLKVLAAIARTRSVSLAAEELGMSQPGVSSALARLRLQIGDRLFVRTARGMEPTPRADSILAPIGELLGRLADALSTGTTFDPATSATTFKLALSDVGEMAVASTILRDIQSRAPATAIQTLSLDPSALATALEDGTVDLAIGYYPDLDGAGIFRQRLYHHRFTCFVRQGHALTGPRISRKDYEAHGHVIVRTPVRSQEIIDRVIQQSGVQRRGILHTGHYLTVPLIVASSELIATVPEAVGASFVQMGVLRRMAPPFDAPDFPIHQHWHGRFHEEPRSRWLRERVFEVLSNAFGATGGRARSRGEARGRG